MTNTVRSPRARPGRATPYLWTLGLLWVLPVVAVAVGYLVLDKDVPPGACEGIGFGCELAPADGLVFLAVVFGVPVLFPAGVIGVVAVALVQWRRDRLRREP